MLSTVLHQSAESHPFISSLYLLDLFYSIIADYSWMFLFWCDFTGEDGFEDIRASAAGGGEDLPQEGQVSAGRL